jgi:hypothetical protein
MKTSKAFIIAIILFILFEIARVYFIMPMPGSQRMHSIDFAYFLHSYRWLFRLLLAVVLILSLKTILKQYLKTGLLMILLLGGIGYATNFPMSADTMFKTMNHQNFANQKGNFIDSNRLIIGVVIGTEARAYPINIIAHHHQVKDKIAGKDILVTYCSVCRTGRIYEPKIDGKIVDFRLVGMDHFNAMFEDPETKSWWRQVNGTCIAGSRKGKQLADIPCYQTTLKTWLVLYPNSLILQQDEDFNKDYKDLEKFDDGSVKSKLIGRNSKPNEFKSWVVWVKNNNQIKSVDWSIIEKNGYVLKEFGNTTGLIISNDKQSIFAFDLNSLIKTIAPRKISSLKVQSTNFEIISNLGDIYRYDYKGIVQNFKDSTIQLKQIPCTQEFKHSFEDFQLLNNH